MKNLLSNSAVQIALTTFVFIALFVGIVVFAYNVVGLNDLM